MGARFYLNITLKCHLEAAFFLPIEDSSPTGKNLNRKRSRYRRY